MLPNERYGLEKVKPKKYKILSVGKDTETLSHIQKTLSKLGCDVINCTGVEKAIGILEFRKVDIVISEMEMPVVSGVDLLRYVKENLIDTLVDAGISGLTRGRGKGRR